jgi:protein gp37
MGETTGIAWTDSTFNPWVGCTKVSAACDHCYAETWSRRTGHPELWRGERRRTSASNWQQPLKWNRKAVADGVRRRVFCASLADVFDNQVPERWRDDLWHRIAQTPQLDWLLLTKRPQNIRKMLPDPRIGTPAWNNGWANVWLGTTAEDQPHFNDRWRHLREIPARVRFISYEPALGPLSLPRSNQPDWVIVGGESGGHARPFDLTWARAVRDECKSEGIACFIKQLGARPFEEFAPGCDHFLTNLRDRAGADPVEWPADLRVQEFPDGCGSGVASPELMTLPPSFDAAVKE